MKLAAGAQLRSLVEDATLMSGAINALNKSSPHAIAPGIKAKKSYVTDLGKFALPNSGPGMRRLQALGTRAIPGLGEEESRAAWSSLLQMPRVILHPILPAGTQWVSTEGAVKPEMLRQLTLVSVFRHDAEALDGGVIRDARFAGVATLTLAMSKTRGGTSDAWLTTTWHESTRSFMSALEPVFAAVGIAHTSFSRSIAVVFNGDQIDLADSLRQNQIRTSAAVAGVEVQLMNLSAGQDAAFVAKTLSHRVPNQLILVGDGEPLEEVANAFGDSNGYDRVIVVAHDSYDDVLQYLRERFAAAVGVSPSLHLQIEHDTSTQPKSSKIPFPFDAEPKDCLHLDDGRRYLSDPVTGLYWTRDTAKHGGVQFKTYTRTKTHLVFESDRSDDGSKISNKHKGQTLFQIELSDLNRCSNAQAHKS